MEDTNNAAPAMMPHAIKNGVMLGLISILIYLGVYMIDIALLVDWKFSLLNFFLFALLTIWLGRKYRGEIGGYMTYGEAFQYAFVMLVISSLFGLAFNIILFNFIDPELPQTLTRMMLESQEKMLISMGASDATIDDTLSMLEEDMPNQYTVMGQLKNSWAVVIGAAIYAVIAAIFIKKKKPDFES